MQSKISWTKSTSRFNITITILLFLITVLTRLPFTSKILTHWDSVQFALATEKYDIAIHQPHPPGYFLYVMIGKVLNLVLHDVNASFVAMSVVASGLAVSFIFLLTNKMYDKTIALWSSILAITSPLFWLHGEVALTYILEAFFSVSVAYFCWRISKGEYKLIFFSALLLALEGGIRQSTLVFLLPLWIYSIRRAPYKYIFGSFVLLAIGVLSWVLPMLWMTGGYARYKAATDELWAYHYKTYSVINSGFRGFFDHIKEITRFITYGLELCTAFIAFYFLRGHFKNIRKNLLSERAIFIALWMIPSLLFYLLISPGNPGCSLIFMPALLIMSVAALQPITERVKSSQMIFSAIMLLAAIFNLYIFLYTSSPMSLYMLNRQHADVLDFVGTVRREFSPSETLIVSQDYAFCGPRHFMYYMPEYKIYLVDERVDSHGRKRKIVWWQNHDTFISDAVYVPEGIKYFVSPMDDKSVLANMKKSGEKIYILSHDKKNIAFYGDISLASKAYAGMKFVIEK